MDGKIELKMTTEEIENANHKSSVNALLTHYLHGEEYLCVVLTCTI